MMSSSAMVQALWLVTVKCGKIKERNSEELRPQLIELCPFQTLVPEFRNGGEMEMTRGIIPEVGDEVSELFLESNSSEGCESKSSRRLIRYSN